MELIKHEHGTAHAEIMEMPICLLRQTVELIRQRRTDEARLGMRVTEWQTKQLAGIIVQTTTELQDRGRRMLMQAVQSMQLGVGEDTEAKKSTDTRSIEEIIEQGAIVEDSAVASAEMFGMWASGGPS